MFLDKRFYFIMLFCSILTVSSFQNSDIFGEIENKIDFTGNNKNEIETYLEYDNNNTLSISINTDGFLYAPSQRVTLQGQVNDLDMTDNIKYKVLIEAKNTDTQTIEYRSTMLTMKDGYFVDTGLITESEGAYVVTATVSKNDKIEQAWATFEIKDVYFFESMAGVVLITGILNFIALIVLILLRINNPSLIEILRFIFISGIAISGILVFLLVDVEIGVDAPIGLVSKTSFDERGIVESRSWVINVGGNPLNYYQEGIQIPINIVVFGIAGGYLRYLYKTATTVKLNSSELSETPSRSELVLSHMRVFHNSLEDLVLFILAPILAVALWFLLVELEISSVYTLALASFTAGLVTNEIINTLINVVNGLLRGINGSTNNDPTNNKTKN